MFTAVADNAGGCACVSAAPVVEVVMVSRCLCSLDPAAGPGARCGIDAQEAFAGFLRLWRFSHACTNDRSYHPAGRFIHLSGRVRSENSARRIELGRTSYQFVAWRRQF